MIRNLESKFRTDNPNSKEPTRERKVSVVLVESQANPLIRVCGPECKDLPKDYLRIDVAGGDSRSHTNIDVSKSEAQVIGPRPSDLSALAAGPVSVFLG